MRGRLVLAATAALLIALDRATKLLIVESLPPRASETVIPGFFNLVHARNTGIAFSLFHDAAPWFREFLLPAVSAAAVIALAVFLGRAGKTLATSHWALTLVLAGAAGNLYDRAAYGYVVDFLDLYVGSWHWPAFNVADSCITVGAGLLLLDAYRKPVAEPRGVARSV